MFQSDDNHLYQEAGAEDELQHVHLQHGGVGHDDLPGLGPPHPPHRLHWDLAPRSDPVQARPHIAGEETQFTGDGDIRVFNIYNRESVSTSPP